MDRISTLEPSVNGVSKPRKSNRKASEPKQSKSAPKPRSILTHNNLTIGVACAAAASTVITSMSLNVWAFTHEVGSTLGTAVGLLLPLWVLAGTYLGQRMHAKERKWEMGGCYALAAFMLAVSLPHLAHGYATVVPAWEGWCLAVVTDLLQVACKLVVIRVVRGR